MRHGHLQQDAVEVSRANKSVTGASTLMIPASGFLQGGCKQRSLLGTRMSVDTPTSQPLFNKSRQPLFVSFVGKEALRDDTKNKLCGGTEGNLLPAAPHTAVPCISGSTPFFLCFFPLTLSKLFSIVAQSYCAWQ